MKQCTKCGAETNSKNSWCSGCWKEHRYRPEVSDKTRAYMREHKRKSREKPEVIEYEKLNRRKWNLGVRLKKFNLTLQQYEQMLFEQDNRCKICKTEEQFCKNGLAIDHDHKTGIVRGLLCIFCNTGIGHFKENEELLKEAIKYLQKSVAVI